MKITLPGWINRFTSHAWLPLLIIGVQLSASTANAAPWFDQQTISVSGKVVSAQDPAGVPGVNIVVKGTTIGTVTDANGAYKLEVPDRNSVLVFSFIGFESQEQQVSDRTVIDVTLDVSSVGLQELIVVGYGTQEKVTITNAVAQIEGEDIVRRPVTSLQQSMQGKIAGVTILDRGGSPGAPNTQIIMRGTSRPYTPVGLNQANTSGIGDNSPIVFVDGIEQPYQNINPADIETITALKDAASTAIYGSRAANGVILITTKRAKEGKVQVSYSGFYALQESVTQPKAMDINSYLQLENIAYTNVGTAIPASLPQYTSAGMAGYAAGTVRNPLRYPLPYDWYNVMLKTAPQVNNTISVAGGNENFRSRASIRYQNQDGIMANTNSKLTDVRLGSDIKLSDKVNLSVDLNYRFQNSTEPNDMTNIWRLFMQNAIWAVPQYPNGDYGGGTQGNSPLLLAEKGGYNKTKSDYLFGGIKGNWEIVKGLRFTSQLGFRMTDIANKNFVTTWETRDSTTVKKTNLINSLRENRTFDKEITWNNLLNYDVDFGKDHNLKTLLGYSQIYHENSFVSAYRQGFYNNDVQALSQGTNDATQNATGSDYTWGLRSYFARINYAFKGRYLFEANGRYDGSSKFSSENKYAFFPSFSAGWRISEEAFFGSLRNTVSSLKLRGSWGQTGNQALDLYQFYPTMSAVSYDFNNTVVQGYLQKQISDPGLHWETTAQTDIGLDAELFEGKLMMTVDYYNKQSKDLLLTLPVPGVTGLAPNFQNAGRSENKGWEFQIGTRNQFGKLNLTTLINFTTNNNQMTDMAGSGNIIQGDDIDPRYITGVGYPINAYWGYQTDGLYQDATEAAAAPIFMRAAKPGDVKMVDRNGDGKINPDDMTYLGNSIPRYTFGGTFNLNYKAFTLNLFLQGAADVKMRIARALGEAGNFEGFTPDIYTNNYWTPEHTDARFARPTKQDLRNQASTDRMLVDASYLRVKNIQLTYQLPTTLLQKVSLTGASVYFSATNVLTFSKLNEWHLDPESSSGWQNYYPQTKMYTLGVNLQF
jgi:TonB-linked SusC/RagA family outer membrane protein